MSNTILNETDDYLVRCRGRNNRDMERTLRSYLKKLYVRDSIPLDPCLYPDYMAEDMRLIGSVASRLLDQLDVQVQSGLQIKQLQLSFGMN